MAGGLTRFWTISKRVVTPTMLESLNQAVGGSGDAKAIAQLIQAARRVLVVTHVAPDGDAIGSLLGLGWLLRGQGLQMTLVCEDLVPDLYRWLPGAGEVVPQGEGRYDLVISLDCSDPRRMGHRLADESSTAGVPLLNVDHHVTNTWFGAVNWVDTASVATAQMVLALAEACGWELTGPIAVCLLCGLVTDTRAFRTSNVDAAAVRAALRLMEAGASLSEISRRVLEQRPMTAVRLWGEALGQMQLEDGILWVEITQTMRQRWGASEDGDSGLANFMSGVREASIAIVFSERNDGMVEVGLRAAPGYDVAQAALRLGGGGHPQAAGCTLTGDLAAVRGRVLAEVRRSLEVRPGEWARAVADG